MYYVVFTNNISNIATDIVNSITKHSEDKLGTVGCKSVEGLPLWERVHVLKPLGEGVL